MQLTSFQRALLYAGGGVVAVGAGVGLFMARGRREEAADREYRAAGVSVDQFVDRTMTAFDRGTYGDPLTPTDDSYRARYEPDGRISRGAEDLVNEDAGYFREIVNLTEDSPYGEVLNGRRFMKTADANDDGHVTREELRAAVAPFAGDDGQFDLAERRRVLVDEGLATRANTEELKPIAGWDSDLYYDSGNITTAHAAAHDLLYDLVSRDAIEQGEDGQSAIRLSKVQPTIPWAEHGTRLATGDVSSNIAKLTALDDASDGNGLLTTSELAVWVAEEFADDGLVPGHVRWKPEQMLDTLRGVRIARVDATSLSGKVYWDTTIPAADVERFFDGDIPTFVDGLEGFRQARGGVEWEADPLSGKPSPKPKDQDGG